MIWCAVTACRSTRNFYSTVVCSRFYSSSHSRDKTNILVHSKTQGRLTNVFQECSDDLKKIFPGLLRALEPQGLSNGFKIKLYKIIQIRNLHSRSSLQGNLDDILNNKILKENVVWEKVNFMLKVNLGDGITAQLLPGAEEHNTSIIVTDGTRSVSREIQEYWLENWSVAKEKV